MRSFGAAARVRVQFRRSFSSSQNFDSRLPIEKAITPPAEWYTSSAVHAREKRTIFDRSWVFAARKEQLGPAPGSYFSGKFLDNPFIIIRGDDGKLRAFFNVCTHHGGALIKPEEACTGRKNKLTCCYHGWTFNLCGQLTKAVKLKGIQNFVPAEWGLTEIPLEEWGPFVFVCFGGKHTARGNAGEKNVGKEGEQSSVRGSEVGKDRADSWRPRDLKKDLSPFCRWLDKFGYPDINEPITFVGQKVFDIKCNWKIINDNYLDGVYHIPCIHPGLNSALSMESYHLHNYDRLLVQVANASEADAKTASSELADFQNRYGPGPVYGIYYPTFALNRFGHVLESNVLLPLSHERTLLVADFFIEPSKAHDKEFVERTIRASVQVQDEDTGICELLHTNMKSSGYRPGRYSPSMEGATYHFHQLLAQDLGYSA